MSQEAAGWGITEVMRAYNAALDEAQVRIQGENPESELSAALKVFMQGLAEYERDGGCAVSYSVFEIPKLFIADAVLRMLGYPTAPDPPARKREPAPSGYRKAAISRTLRWAVFKRDGFRCVDCGTQDDLSADHVIPESKGGPTTFDNLKTRCCRCNSRKGVKPEVSAC